MSASASGEGRIPFARHWRARLWVRVILATFVVAGAGILFFQRWGSLGTARHFTDPQVPLENNWFVEVSDAVGVRFIHDPGPVGSFFMPQIMGSGAALFDFDQDGKLDIFLLQGAGPDSPSRNSLFRQVQGGRFEDVSVNSGLDFAGFCTGVAIGDVNNDGFPDVLVTLYGGVKLFLNNKGNGTFTDATQEAGLGTSRWATSAAFFDYDRDGWLDLVVVHYVEYDPTKLCHYPQGKRDYCHPRFFASCCTQLYHNLGKKPATPGRRRHPSVHFDDVTEQSGLARQRGPGLGVVCLDFDGDGWPDILIANDGRPNHLWINQKNGTFAEEAMLRGLACDGLGRSPANMGIAVGDADGDGLFDVFVTHLTEETHTLWNQGPRGLFHDRTGLAGLAPPHSRGTGFGTVMADFDQDGWPDIAVVNGRVARHKAQGEGSVGSFWSQYAEQNQLFGNRGKGSFTNVAQENPVFCGMPAVWRGLAVGDVDGDGALDLLATTIGGPARLFRNVVADRGHWLMVRAVDPAINRDAYGAELALHVGDRRRWGWINPGSSYQCSNDPRAHFGLGAAVAYDRLVVRWPDGSEETFPGGAADRLVVLLKGRGEAR
jgi:hypothetical protein